MPPHQNLETKYERRSIIRTLEEVGLQWRTTVVHTLREGDLQFNELKYATSANSQMFSHMLDDSQELGYVERKVEDGSPIAVYYSFMQKGKELLPALDGVSEWGEKWISKDGGTES